MEIDMTTSGVVGEGLFELMGSSLWYSKSFSEFKQRARPQVREFRENYCVFNAGHECILMFPVWKSNLKWSLKTSFFSWSKLLRALQIRGLASANDTQFFSLPLRKKSISNASAFSLTEGKTCMFGTNKKEKFHAFIFSIRAQELPIESRSIKAKAREANSLV